MNVLKYKKIIIGVTGSIAAYKIAPLIRLFVKAQAEVKVVMTKDATKFISPLTLSTLAKTEVLSDISGDDGWNSHVDLGLWADIFIIAPTTANTLAKLAHGICDNLLTAVYLSAKCPISIAPAMDLDMWKHPTTKNNLKILASFGYQIIDVGDGELASGLIGKGRMAEPEFIFSTIIKKFQETNNLSGKKIMITAGPTYEAIDPVRFIGNRSSGKMGIELAKVLLNQGAEVTLILGPSALSLEHHHLKVINIQSAKEMYLASKQAFPDSDIAIMAAAVSDYTPQKVAIQKIKKTTKDLNLTLIKTDDIAATLGKEKNNQQILVGFALETNNEEANAVGKLKRKNLDIIVLNSLREKGAGFGGDTNKITIFDKSGNKNSFSLKSKAEVAKDIVNYIFEYSKS